MCAARKPWVRPRKASYCWRQVPDFHTLYYARLSVENGDTRVALCTAQHAQQRESSSSFRHEHWTQVKLRQASDASVDQARCQRVQGTIHMTGWHLGIPEGMQRRCCIREVH